MDNLLPESAIEVDLSLTYIYVLVNPHNNYVKYVGKTNDPISRYKGHLEHKNSTPVSHWVNQLSKINIKPKLYIIEIVNNGQEKDREMFWINFWGPNDLLNTNIGKPPIKPFWVQDKITKKTKILDTTVEEMFK